MTTTDHLTIRPAGPADASAVAALAALDSAHAPAGDVLLAEAGGRPVAALSTTTGQAVADPFTPSAAAIAMLRVRAAQIAAPERTTRALLRLARLRTASG